MQILSDYAKDVRTQKFKPGAYEWWYFDGVDNTGDYSLVIIFYEGNPFSTRYIQRLKNWNRSDSVFPEEHPAVSISVYKNQTPIYYSFTEFKQEDCFFDSNVPYIVVGDHTMEAESSDESISYRLMLNEELPSGDAIKGTVTFKSSKTPEKLLESVQEFHKEGHLWNLVQPRADVEANLEISARAEKAKEVVFEGKGYHDHNMGNEPMRNEFNEWYWGRFHFEMGTLVYYMMDRKNEQQHQAWLLSPDNNELIATYPNIDLQDESWSPFGLHTARKLMLNNDKAHITIQQARILDNGPFYQRFSSDSFINIPDEDIMQVAEGISEFIRPDRIYWRTFWPFVNMRIRYEDESPHWVQRSKRLYRWIW
ncbi:hypothetical protein NC796_11745 [Aliifodinibius sp. S!AR15-10]|uniref:hypothetical protein n=1 Tax=Aliifodinibius sp. S!AR15-10 TaxID=2950437 RepID=UPI00285BA3FF|nr:hypothetical protein [Aliifodinibius sp. S!AR15-10]MDR8391821.1 hypothetical protein [Aliifodinibius sp. S!AR15-10]